MSFRGSSVWLLLVLAVVVVWWAVRAEETTDPATADDVEATTRPSRHRTVRDAPASDAGADRPEAPTDATLADEIAPPSGRVVDDTTGDPIAGASLRWGYPDAATGDLTLAIDGRSGADGTLAFVHPRREAWLPDPRDAVAELRAWAEGYHTTRIVLDTAAGEVRLRRRRDGGPLCLRVRALRGDDVPWAGVVTVVASDDFGNALRFRAVPDEAGRFELRSVSPRYERFRLEGADGWTRPTPAGEDAADLDLRGPPVGPFAWLPRDEVVRRRDAAALAIGEAKSRGDAEAAAEHTATWEAAWRELQDRPPETLAMAITNLPADCGPLVDVRVETHTSPIVWRLPVADRSVALRTSRTPPYWWRIVVERGGRIESRSITILSAGERTLEGTTGRDTARTFPVREDGTVVVDWETLLEDG